MAIDGLNNVQATPVQAPQMSQVSQPKVTEVEEPASARTLVEDIKVNTEDVGSGNNREYSNEQIKKTVADMNKKLQNISCQYGIHEGTGRVTIKMVDKETKDVIKEFPAEETLELIAKAWELAGIMVDKRL
jgi:flagellar protein FlaG